MKTEIGSLQGANESSKSDQENTTSTPPNTGAHGHELTEGIVWVPIERVIVGERFRKDIGSLEGLAQSIAELGLLHPIVLTLGYKLLCGLRCLLACRDILKWTHIPARVLDLNSFLEAELADNAFTKALMVSERVAIGKALEAKLGERRGRPASAANADEYHGKRTEDVVAEKCGFGSGDSYRRAKKVVDQGAPELVHALDAGDASIDAASLIASLPVDEQKSTVARGTKAIKASAKKAVRLKMQERHDRNVQAEIAKAKAVAAAVAGERPWSITASQEVIQCDALISDPPYGILKNDWDVPEAELESFTKEWLRRWNTCGADFIACFWSERFLRPGMAWFDECLTNYNYHQLLIWHFSNSVRPPSRQGFRHTFDPILFYRRKDSRKEVAAGVWAEGTNCNDCFVAAIPTTTQNGVNMKQHTAQKPLPAMRWLVNALSQPGELVVDPFCGSGTTGIAAVQLGRRFHGIELKPEYREMSERRIAAYRVAETNLKASAEPVVDAEPAPHGEAAKAA